MNNLGLDLIALITMVIDHIGACYNIEFFRYIGRLSFPIYAFKISEGYIHTKNLKRYLLRLLVFAGISEIPYQLFKYNNISLTFSNVYVTLLLGLISLEILKKNQNKIKKIVAVVLICICAELLGSSYGSKGILLIIIFNLTRNCRLMQFIFMSILWICSYKLYGVFGVCSLGIIWMYKPSLYIKNRISKYFWYWIYPLHLVVLLIIKRSGNYGI